MAGPARSQRQPRQSFVRRNRAALARRTLRLVLTTEGKAPRRVTGFACARCPCFQPHAKNLAPGGITVAEARDLGWRQYGPVTLCPCCRAEMLRKRQRRDRRAA